MLISEIRIYLLDHGLGVIGLMAKCNFGLWNVIILHLYDVRIWNTGDDVSTIYMIYMKLENVEIFQRFMCVYKYL